MKRTIIAGVFVSAVILLAPKITQAQETTYVSNLGQASSGSLAVGSDSWFAALFKTGTNASGYVLDSIQLEMADASGSPSNFMAMIYSTAPGSPGVGSSLGTLAGSLTPVTGGIYTFTPTSNLTLFPVTGYYIVLTAGTAVANGAYDWSYMDANSYNRSNGWISYGTVLISSDGSSWPSGYVDSPQFAINAIPVPEPGVLGLSVLGGLAFLWHRRKSKAVS